MACWWTRTARRELQDMTFVAVLWLALLHALSIAPSLERERGVAADSHAQFGLGFGAPRRHDTAPTAAPTDETRETLRAVRSRSLAGLLRAAAHTNHGARPTAFQLHRLVRLGWTADALGQTFLRHASTAHALASRGSVLPYYPTAPPTRG